jgi:hypothetical protein
MYTGGMYGVAFSMILESLLNFSYLGPFLLVIILKITYNFLYSKFYYMKRIIDVMFILFFITFVRTEFMVMIKVYIIHMSVFLLLVHLFRKRMFNLKRILY